MRLLWVCNVLPPMIADKLNKNGSNKEGWISGALARMIKNPYCFNEKIELIVAYPVSSKEEQLTEDAKLTDSFNVSCMGFYEDTTMPQNYCDEMESRFGEILELCKPDIIHVFGTEFGHTLAVARVVKAIAIRNKALKDTYLPKLLVGLQGIISKCGEEYNCDLPKSVVNAKTFRDLIKKDNIAKQQAKFLARGEREIEALGLTDNVTGRTSFDKEVALSINPNVNYYHMNETLRETVSEGTWDISKCDLHRIFVSQADYPLKGFHILLEAMPTIIEKYPDAHIVVSGANIIAYDSLKEKIKIGGYGKYLRRLIEAYNLKDKVKFIGRIDAEEMKKQYLKCHTYVCASSLENSPNSMGEAMLLGVPVVASRTGGIPSMIDDDEEGLLFEACNSKDLAENIIKIWENDGFAMELGAKGMDRARKNHNPDVNYDRLLEIYSDICK